MAPQETASYYGAVVMDRGEKSAPATSPMAKRIAVAVLAAMALVGVATMMSSSSVLVRETAVVDVAAESLPDCVCISECQYLSSTTGTMFPVANERYATFVDRDVMVCDTDTNNGQCVDVSKGRSGGSRDGLPQKYSDPNGTPSTVYVAICETYDTNCARHGDPCGAHGFCVAKKDSQSEYECVCDPGYSGQENCINVNECGSTDNCNTNGFCTDLSPVGNRVEALTTKKFECGCKASDGYEGDGYDLSTVTGCTDIDMCVGQDCGNSLDGDAGCTDVEASMGVDQYDCHCAIGWDDTDNTCLLDIDECELNECPLNSKCTNTDGSFTCDCKKHWIPNSAADKLNHPGDLVCTSKDYCDEIPCKNGGTCTTGDDGCGSDDRLYTLPESQGTRDVWFEDKKDTEKPELVCFVCACVDGWTGDTCVQDVDECSASSADGPTHGCDLNADCVNTAGSFECICRLGWEMSTVNDDGVTVAEHCVDIDDCADTQPCAHGGTCVDCGTLCFTCSCVVGWRGTTCTKDWNECNMGIHTCNDAATCVNTPGSYDCTCDPGFTGNGFGIGSDSTATYQEDTADSEEVRAKASAKFLLDMSKEGGCIDIDDCGYNSFENPCQNGAACVDVATNHYKCTCLSGWTDTDCDQDVNECNPAEWPETSCSPYATCINKNMMEVPGRGYDCECNTGYSGNGQVCTDIDDCMDYTKDPAVKRCPLHGFCKDLGVDYFKCECDNGWIGSNCDDDENECVVGSASCGRHATCENTDGSYECVCEDGYLGDAYDEAGCVDVDDCTASKTPCFGKGTKSCTDVGVGHFVCKCNLGWTDQKCDFDVNECLAESSPCHPNAACRNNDGGYKCECLAGFDGDGVSSCTDTDDCALAESGLINGGCLNGAICDSGLTAGSALGAAVSGNMRVCHCKAGFRGCGSPVCATDCPDCGAFATDASTCTEVSMGTCTQECNVGYFGAPGACAISCTACTACDTGYKVGTKCTQAAGGDTQCVNIDECAIRTDTCDPLNAGCADNEGSFECSCAPGWFGNGQAATPCVDCTVCQAGFHETSPCTTTTDRVCAVDLPGGEYMMQSEADGNKQCLAILNNEWFPSRVDYGENGPCGYSVVGGLARVKANNALTWKFTALNNNEVGQDSQLYTISHQSMEPVTSYGGDSTRCMYFGGLGRDVYPSLQSCVDYVDEGDCPWGKGKDAGLCDFQSVSDENYTPAEKKENLIANGNAVFKVQAVKMSEQKYIIQAKARDGSGWDCIVFDNEGAATNPSRYNWGNGETFCGVGDWEGYGKEMSLLNNKQAVFILTGL